MNTLAKRCRTQIISQMKYLCSTGVGEGQTSGSLGCGDPHTSGSWLDSSYGMFLTGPIGRSV
jgi:hypothetical protein